jgi:hypothetical protein
MSECSKECDSTECTGEACSSGSCDKKPQSFIEKTHELSNIRKVIGNVWDNQEGNRR